MAEGFWDAINLLKANTVQLTPCDVKLNIIIKYNTICINLLLYSQRTDRVK